MSREHRFGGEWTEEKLRRLQAYLGAYMRIFTKNPRAAFLKTIYVDAFAGTGSRMQAAEDSSALSLFDEDFEGFKKGSARIALESHPPFDRFLFIERRKDFARELKKLKEQFPERSIEIEEEEANAYLRRWALQTNWRTHRAVVFLDPYGMEVDWHTIEALARTEAVDLWILFPLGQAVNRLLTHKLPSGPWAERLTRSFGTDQWREVFYRTSPQHLLFGEQPALERVASIEAIGEYFLERLRSIFAGVSRRALALRNSTGSPIYLLCFAAANEKGAKTAIKIADHILKD